MLRSALLILSGNAMASLLLLLRNLLVARMIPVADYGIASTFAVAMAVVEMASALGLQQQIVQAKEGDDPHFQAALQGFQLLRGLASGAVLFVIAGPMAAFMGIAQVTWAYQLLAVVPVLNALVHFDIHRLNRQMVFWPMLLTGALPALASVLVLWPLAQWYGDWRVLLYAILLQAVLAAVVSHLLAQRPYRVVLDAAIMRSSLRFGWPLLANAVLLFLVFNAERLIVGRELGMAVLAIFSMGLTLTLTPTLVVAKSVQNLLLPPLSLAHDDPGRFARLSVITVQLVLLMGLGFVLAVVLVGAPVTHLLLGAKYDALLPLLFGFAIQQAMRVLKAAPAIIALARGQTGNAMLANLVRISVLPLCWYVAVTSGDLATILWLAAAAEILGYLLAVWLLRDVLAGTGRALVLPHAIFTLTMAALVCWMIAEGNAGVLLAGWPIWLLAAVVMAASLAVMPELRGYIRARK